MHGWHRQLVWSMAASAAVLLGSVFKRGTYADDAEAELRSTTRVPATRVTLSGVARDAEGQVVAVSAATSGGVVVFEDEAQQKRVTANIVYIRFTVEELPDDGAEEDAAPEPLAEESVPTDEEIRKQAEAVLIQRLISAGEIEGERPFQTGIVKHTGNPLDIAIIGDGFFALRTATGDTLYTRVGNFRLDSFGQLVTADGYLPYNDITIPRTIDLDSICIEEDGIITGWSDTDSAPRVIGMIQLFTFENPAALVSAGNHLFSATHAAGQVMQGEPGRDEFGRLCQGCLETGNVDVLTELIDMIGRSGNGGDDGVE